jgi:hypothetical protein
METNNLDVSQVACKDTQRLSVICAPETCRAVGTTSRKVGSCAERRHINIPDGEAMPTEDRDAGVGVKRPETSGAVLRGRDEETMDVWIENP